MPPGRPAAIALYAMMIVLPAHAQDARNREHMRIRSPDGHPCLTFETDAQPEAVMKGTFDHVVRVKNTCPQRIIVDVCYRGSRSGCSRLDLGAYREKTAFLGSMPNQAQFSFDYDEKVAN